MIVAALCVGGTLLGKARAGFKESDAVWVVKNGDGSGYAGGSMGDARSSSDSTQYIGCTLYGTAGTGTMGGC